MRDFSYVDSFERVRLLDNPFKNSKKSAIYTDRKPFVFNNDHSEVFFATIKGDAKASTYRFNLIKLSINELKNYLAEDGDRLPQLENVLEVSYNQSDTRLAPWESAGIGGLQLYNGGRDILYRAPDNNGIFQIFTANVYSGLSRKITNENDHVLDYFFSDDAKEIIYKTGHYEPQEHCRETSFLAHEKFITDTICLENGQSWLDFNSTIKPILWGGNRMYSISLAPDTTPRLISSGDLVEFLPHIQPSPDGSHILLKVKMKKPSDNIIKAYKSSDIFKRSFLPSLEEAISISTAPDYWHYAIVNLRRGRLIPMVGLAADDSHNAEARWDGNDRLTIRNVDVIAPVNLASSSSEVNNDMSRSISIQLSGDNYAIEHAAKNVRSAAYLAASKGRNLEKDVHGVESRCQTDDYGGIDYGDGKAACYIESNRAAVRIAVEESYNQPPILVATDLKSGKTKIIADLNPQFNAINLSRTEIFNWIDKNGEKWVGGLVFPKSYRLGEKYPIVIQMLSFDRNLFLVDGGPFYSTPFAAQALASREMFVLQVPKKKFQGKQGLNFSGYAAGVDAALELLNKDGLINLSKIGMVGFSATGRIVFNLSVFAKYPPKAILISDAMSPSPLAYAYSFRSGYKSINTHEEIACHNLPWGTGQAEWVKRNPFFHLDKLHSAVRIEQYSPQIPDWWDIFTGLHRLNKPVELELYTTGGHPPLNPNVFLALQAKVIDWFDFWLNEREAMETGKQKQYERWRVLRRLKKEGHNNYEDSVPLSEMPCPSNVDGDAVSVDVN